jgi:hypothetical protein
MIGKSGSRYRIHEGERADVSKWLYYCYELEQSNRADQHFPRDSHAGHGEGRFSYPILVLPIWTAPPTLRIAKTTVERVTRMVERSAAERIATLTLITCTREEATRRPKGMSQVMLEGDL